jgi:hypothetical protein
MAFAVKDRVKEISSTTGTGSLTLGGAVTGYQSFNAALSNGDTTYYVIENPNTSEWETGLGTFTSPSTLARTTVLSSSTGSAVSFTAGVKNVFISLPATQFPAANTTIVGTDATQTLTNKSISGASNTVTNVSLTTGVTGTLPVANGGTGVTSSTGSGNNVLSTSPTLVTPLLGTPTSVTLTNATGLPLTTGVTGTLPAANGGTAQSTYATGDTLYASALNTVSKLTIGSAGQVLTVAAGIPSWATLSTSAVTTFSAGTTGFTPSTATSGAITLAGTLAVANGGTGVSGFGLTVAYAANDTLTADDSFQKSTNTGAAGSVTLTLPTPADGLEFTFICTVAQNFILDVGGSVVIAIGEIEGTAGGGASCSSPYSSITLSYGGPDLWVATSSLGNWAPS